MNHHIIYRQKAVVTVAREAEAYAMQKEIGDVMRNELPQLLQDVFDAISPNGDIIRIDCLQVDLGVLPLYNTRQAFKEKIVEKIREAVTIKNGSGATEDGVRVIHKEQSLREAFLYFLQYGMKPWYMAEENREDLESSMQQRFAGEDWKKIIVWLRQNHLHQPVIIERLVLQFSDSFLEELIRYVIDFDEEKWSVIYRDLVVFFAWFEADKNVTAKDEVFIRCLTAFLNHQQLQGALYEVIKTKFSSLIHKDVFAIQQQMTAHNNMLTGIVQKNIQRLAEEVSNREKKESRKERTDAGIVAEDGTEKNIGNQQEEMDTANIKTDSRDQRNRNKPSADLVEKEPQYVSNSGIILLHPYLEMYFAEFGLIKQKRFISEEGRKRAVLLLHYLATGETKTGEWNLVLQKLVCGLPFDETLPDEIELTALEREESEKLLQSVINYCPPLKNTSLAGLRSTFLQRDGRLEKKQNGWLLTVEQKTVDVLLDKLPWGFSIIKLPWLTHMITVDWC